MRRGARPGACCARPAAAHDRRARRRSPASAWRRRCWRCAAATWPPTTASSTRRSPPTRTTASAADAAKEHDRCGSNLVAPHARRRPRSATWPSAARACAGRRPTARVALGSDGARGRGVRLVGAPPDVASSRAVLRRPGYEIQRAVGTREPTTEQLEVGRAALEEILRAEPGVGPPTIRGVATDAVRTRLDPAVFRLPVDKIREGYYTTRTSTTPRSCSRPRTGTRA